MKAMKRCAGFTVAAALLLLLLSGAARAGTTPLGSWSDNGILIFKSADSTFMWWLDARLNLDATWFVEDKNSLGDCASLRRARLAIKTVLWRDWYAEMDVDLSKEAVGFDDAYLRYDNLLGHTGYARLGNFREPFGLEENTTSRCEIFPERSMGTDGFVPGRKMGVEVAHFTPRYRVAAGVFGPDVTEFETTKTDMVYNFTGRATWNPMRDDRSVLHLGLAGSLRQPQFDAGVLRFKPRNEYHSNNYKFLDTDNISSVDTYTLLGGEFAYVRSRVRVQSEYVKVHVNRLVGSPQLPDLDFGGGYVFASVFLTGDSHLYDWQNAEFGRVAPTGKSGAVELVARYSTVNLNDMDVLGGYSSAYTLGANWYANANVRFFGDYVMVNNDKHATGKGSLVGNDDFKFFTFRCQVTF
jgi:phosphate-selective porin OprO and OprP